MTESVIRPDGGPERRRANRAALALDATVRVPGRNKAKARVIDISTHGCRIECSSPAEPDSKLWLNIAGLEAQQCRVAWRCEEFAGVEFEAPIAEAVLAKLLEGHEQVSEKAIGELRAIATRTHWLAVKAREGEIQTLADLSRECAVDAVVEGLRLTEARRRPRAS